MAAPAVPVVSAEAPVDSEAADPRWVVTAPDLLWAAASVTVGLEDTDHHPLAAEAAAADACFPSSESWRWRYSDCLR